MFEIPFIITFQYILIIPLGFIGMALAIQFIPRPKEGEEK